MIKKIKFDYPVTLMGNECGIVVQKKQSMAYNYVSAKTK